MDLNEFFPKAHPQKEFFTRSAIPVAAVAKFLGLSPSYTCSLLNGFARITPDNERKLAEFARLVEIEVQGKK
jgi:plasmid maintenance system antidote protein VapI